MAGEVVNTRDPAGPHDEGTHGICGEPAPMLRLLEGVPRPGPPCELLAGHPGWHRAPQVGTSPMHWGPNETMGYDFPTPISPETAAELERLRAEVARLSALLDEERRKVERIRLACDHAATGAGHELGWIVLIRDLLGSADPAGEQGSGTW